MNTRALYTDNLALIKELIDFVCRRNGLASEEAEDFAAEIHVKLIDEDYAVFRKFRGDAGLKTYLSMVVQRAFQDYRNKFWGKWRPSTQAKRLGEVAVRLETLIYRDGYRFDEAVQIMHTNDHVLESERELAELFQELPIRSRRLMVDEETLVNLAQDQDPQDMVLIRQQEEREREKIEAALDEILNNLDAEESFLITMHFRQNMTLAHIARMLDQKQKPLYRKLEKTLVRMRAGLEEMGIMKQEISELLNGVF